MLQVLILQEKLEERDAEITRLKEEMQQRSTMNDEKTEAAPPPPDNKEDDGGDEGTIVEVTET